MYDLLIKNALLCDGTLAPSYSGALAVSDGRIVAIGTDLDAPARDTIDAGGMVLAPGCIDSHTHFDAQITWDGLATPSLEHGVTTIINGNCSLTMAPVRAQHREFAGAVFRQIEEMPSAAFDACLRWNWETFGDYLASFRSTLGINVATRRATACCACGSWARPPANAARQRANWSRFSPCCGNVWMPERWE